MALSAYAERVVNASATIEYGSNPLFMTFVRVALGQLRSPYVGRTEPEQVLMHLAETWDILSKIREAGPLVVSNTHGNRSVFCTWMEDQSFIVDTVQLALARGGRDHVIGFNLVVSIGRDDEGRIVRVQDPSDRPESITRFEVAAVDIEEQDDLTERIRAGLRQSKQVAADFQAMTRLVNRSASRLNGRSEDQGKNTHSPNECSAFLRWLVSDNFVFMGAIMGDKRFGLANPDLANIRDASSLEQLASIQTNEPVMVRKSRQESSVHRSGQLDQIRVIVPGKEGEEDSVLVMEGLFTYRAVTQASRHIPLLRRVLRALHDGQQAVPGSFHAKRISNVFDSLPTEYLFTADVGQIADMIERVLEAEQESDVRVHMSQSNEGTVSFVLAALPRRRWDESLRRRIEDVVVEATGASYWDQGIFVGRYETMLAHIYLTGTHLLDDDAVTRLQEQVAQAAKSWTDRVYELIHAEKGEAQARDTLFEYGSAFQEIYQTATPPERAVRDIELLERLDLGDGRIQADLYVNAKGRLTLRLYQLENLILSEILPVLDHFGLVITDQYHDPVQPRNKSPRSVDTFRLSKIPDLDDEAVVERRELLVDALRAVFSGRISDDVFNRLVLAANLPWEAIDMVRGYFGYARQLGLPYTATRIHTLLQARPTLLRALWDYFQARFDPKLSEDRKKRMNVLEEDIDSQIRGINNHDLDMVYRTLFNLMNSTLRTNFYRTDRKEHYISFKIDCSKVGNMPAPRMVYEIYVHHREMEGVHLRGGSIARGGIRWSDRQDYRREILDLATTQRVKNVLIVPEGAKGGFYITQPISDRAERRRRADELYQILIRGLLDVTDNVSDGEVLPPPDIVRHDGNDPYLVVAADKGTAHLSDTANGLSREYGFWLDDAFASGGSNGYDHKKVGITARGGWMTVRRLFRENGLEPETDTFTVAGVGDTGGDVFGNGVIEHDTIKLVAAFNHLHIFLDPDPDPKKSYAERMRLFREAKGWADYDTTTLSEGGGIFSRQSKSIPLTPQIQELLGVLKDELPVDTVIRLILRMKVDLLWNGGIGTYVKASHESHAEAGDPSNDSVRVNASELRCKTVGEGGNLGFTQAARVEFALHGGDINTDFIDNSGGVDMSDHEVNLKILLNPMVKSGAITVDERNSLLEKLTDTVADDVLNNNDNHARQLSLDVLRSERDPMWFSSSMDWACQRSGTTRVDLQLPSDDDLLRRVSNRQGLTRPELATLQAHVKIHAYNALQKADTDALPGFDDMVLEYFPSSVARRWPAAIAKHMLYQSIGATVLTNRIVGLSGAWFYPLVSELTGASIERITSAWIHAYGLVGGHEIAKELDSSEAPFHARYKAWIMVSDMILDLVVGWCTPGEGGPDEEQCAQIKEALQRIGRIGGTAKDERIAARTHSLESRDIPAKLARRIARLGEISIAREVVLIKNEEDGLRDTIVRYLAVGEASRILPAVRSLTMRRSSGGWDPVATGILRYRYILVLRALIAVLPKNADVRLGTDRMAARLGLRQMRDLQELLDHILGDDPSISALLVAEARIKAWIEQQS